MFSAAVVIVCLLVAGAGLWMLLDLFAYTPRAAGGRGFGTAILVFIGLICLAVVGGAIGFLFALVRPKRAGAPASLSAEGRTDGEPTHSGGGPYPASEASIAAAAGWQTRTGPPTPEPSEAEPGESPGIDGMDGTEGESGNGNSGAGDSTGSSW